MRKSLFSLFHRAPAMPQMPELGKTVLSAREVSVIRSGKEILNDFSIDLHAGEVVVMVGPNGAGKSTALAALSGELTADSGQVKLFDREISTWTPRQAAMRRAVLLQDTDIAFPFTTEEVVEMGRSPWDDTADAALDDQIIDSAMAMTEVSHLRTRRYTSLSGGERARAALARVLVQAAPIMMLDEPTAALDIKHQEQVLQLARDYAQTGCAAIIVLHNLELAAAYADRVAVLSNGHLLDIGSPKSVLTPKLLTDVYGYPIEVFAHPLRGSLLIQPVRDSSGVVRE